MKFFKKMAAVAAAAAVATISLAGMSSMTTSAAGDIGIAELKGQMGTYQYWGASKNNAVGDIKSTPAVISGDGQYTTTLTLGGDGTGTIEFLILELDANSENYITQDTYPDMKIEINSIKADGVEQNFTADADGGIDYKYYEDGTGKTRVYLCNTWSTVNGGKSLGLSGTTPVTKSIDVTFTISGIEAGGGTATTDPASTTKAPQETDPNGTTADPNKTTTAAETTTTAAGGNGDSSNGNSGNGGSSNGNSSSGGSSSSNSSKSGTNNAKTSQTGDFGIAAVALGAVATAALGVGAYTITRKKK